MSATKIKAVRVRMAGAPVAQPGDIRTRLTGTPVFGPGVNHEDALRIAAVTGDASHRWSQLPESERLATQENGPAVDGSFIGQQGAGGHAAQDPVNHAQVLVPHADAAERQLLLATLAVNLKANRLGRTHVLDDVLHGRLVSLAQRCDSQRSFAGTSSPAELGANGQDPLTVGE